MRAPSPPPAPDPYATAKAQTDSNVNTAISNTVMSNANEFSPYGSVTYEKWGETMVDGRSIPVYNRFVNLSPEQQAMFNQEQQLGRKAGDIALAQADKIGSILNSPIAAAPGLKSVEDYLNPNGPQGLGALRDRSEKALLDRLNPQLERDQAALETRLVNQGLARDSELFRTYADEAGRQRNDARLAAIAQGGAEADRALNQANVYANSYNTATQGDWQNEITRRTQPINELTGLMGMQQVQVPKAPPFQAGEVAGTPVGDYVYKSAQINQQNWMAQQQARSQMMGSLFGLGGSMLGGLFRLSDRRTKQNVRALGVRLPSGFDLYAYEHPWDTSDHVGVMADEVEAVRPEAVVTMPNGLKAVDYAQVL